MVTDKSINFTDLLLSILRRKKMLLTVFAGSVIIFYLLIYFFIPEKYDSHAIVIPSQESPLTSGISGIMNNLKDLPLGLGLGGSKENSTYLTILYSRSSLEKIIKKFDLMKDYDVDYMEQAVKALKKDIDAEINDEDALEITVSAYNPKKAADITNFILSELNERIIRLNVTKSRDNRIFLENRYNEINSSLAKAEDSLQQYQEKSKVFEIEEQSKLLIDNYSKLESELIRKQMEYSVLKQLYPENSPLVKNLNSEILEFQKEVNKIKYEGKDNSLFIAINALPQKAKSYIRVRRDVEIYTAILEFLIPIYEQAKFDEQRNMPVLQIIDDGNVPEKKAYPPRLLFSIIATLILILFIILFIIVRDIFQNTSNEKLLLIKKEFSIKNTN